MGLHPCRLMVLVAALTAVTNATQDRFRSTCVESCKNSISPVIFSDIAPELPYEEHQHCGALTRNIALQKQNETCQQAYGVTIPPFSILDSYTSEVIARLPIVHRSDSFVADKPLHEAVVPSREHFHAWLDTLDAWQYVSINHASYGLAVMAFWLIVMFIGILNRVYNAFFLSNCQFSKTPYMNQVSPVRNSWLQRNFFLPATFGYKCAQSVWWCTIPSRLQTVTIAAFVALNTGYCVLGYRFTRENYYFETYTEQALRYVSDRTGIISFANFPIIWLFGMRNNIAMWLTGWDFGTYNNFHRWTARFATLQALVHSFGYIILLVRNDWSSLWAEFLEQYWQAGVLATIFMTLLTPFSVQYLRRRHYETFLLIHIALSLLVLLTMLGHVSIFAGQYDILFWIPAYIWIFDRILRFIRISLFRPFSWTSNASASYNKVADIVTLSVPVARSSLCKPKPGTFYYIMVTNDRNCWESHPFTVASVPANTVDVEQPLERTALLCSPNVSEVQLQETCKEELPKDIMTFLIRPYNSFTKRLRELATLSSSLRIMVEGPYGATHPLHNYSRVVFIVGGTGIIAPLSYLPSLLGRKSSYAAVEIHWSVREVEFAKMVVQEHLDIPRRTGELVLKIYRSSATESLGQEDTFIPQVLQEARRPNSLAIIDSAVAAAGGCSVAVVACGPEGMLDDARLGVVRALKHAQGRVDYFQDSFSW